MRLIVYLVLAWLLALPAAADSSRSLAYNARNQLTHVIDVANPARNVAFTYDANGNRETKTQGGVTTTYRWDARNRLIEVLRDGTWLARYEYDSAGRRTRKDVNGPAPTAVRYLYDGPRLVAETNVIGNTPGPVLLQRRGPATRDGARRAALFLPAGRPRHTGRHDERGRPDRGALPRRRLG